MLGGEGVFVITRLAQCVIGSTITNEMGSHCLFGLARFAFVLILLFSLSYFRNTSRLADPQTQRCITGEVRLVGVYR